MFMVSASYLILLVMVLVGVAFVTLMEQKILAGTQIRVGPNNVGYWGLFQPFADAVKLLNKETASSRAVNLSVYYVSPVLSLSLALVLWVVYPFSEGGLDLMFSVLFFMCISGLGVYPILSSGWSSNCKYSMLGSLRAVAQMVSYEVSLAMILLSIIWVSGSFSFSVLMNNQYLVWNMFLFSPLGYVWLVSSLAETNRTPYDFAEGESELVSGFNTEYGSGGFTLIFMGEYANILLMSVLFSIMFVSSGPLSGSTLLKGMLVGFWFVWVRATLPRYRYDKLMGLAWKSFLPVSLVLFSYYLMAGQ
uniref:NADH-ubiquinone oxidoreductase chain 1 n=1 Tax=Gammarus duebeni TaxID=178002 RepID=H9M5S1_9CRUS|nr:NADH dehydrogenase subunit 1 [Gammarus duebeni]AER12200.1 NADH dehydrogenase subunit 1 [Gammarus duebeni]